MTTMFRKATKAQSRARVALIGPAGSGKTYTALILATSLGQRVAVIDTERGSASKYADLFGFDVLELDTFDPRTYIAAINAAQQAGYDVLVIDSLSHAWTGKGGVLEIKDAATRRSKSNDSFGAGWREASPLHNQLVDAMLQARVHLIATMRAKTEYLVTKNAKGETKIEKVGLAPVQRDGLEYEFDIVGDLDGENNLVVSKTRCPALSGVVVNHPDAKLAQVISDWLSDGVPENSPGPAAAPHPVPAGPGDATPNLEPWLSAIDEVNGAKALCKQHPPLWAAAKAFLKAHDTDPDSWWKHCTDPDEWRSVLVAASQSIQPSTAAEPAPPPAAVDTSSLDEATKEDA
jgi:AAA domain